MVSQDSSGPCRLPESVCDEQSGAGRTLRLFEMIMIHAGADIVSGLRFFPIHRVGSVSQGDRGFCVFRGDTRELEIVADWSYSR